MTFNGKMNKSKHIRMIKTMNTVGAKISRPKSHVINATPSIVTQLQETSDDALIPLFSVSLSSKYTPILLLLAVHFFTSPPLPPTKKK